MAFSVSVSVKMGARGLSASKNRQQTSHEADLLLKGFRFEMCFAKRAESVHAEHDLVSILTEHECERVELAVKRTDRIDGAVTRLWFKKGTDVGIVVRF